MHVAPHGVAGMAIRLTGELARLESGDVLSPLFSCSRCSSLLVSWRGGGARAFMRCTHLSSIALCLGGAIEASSPRAGAARHGGVRGSRAWTASGWTLPEWQIDAAVASVR